MQQRYIRRKTIIDLIPQGVFAAEVGVPRLLKLFKKYNMKTSWFIPGKCLRSQIIILTQNKLGHSLESFPEQMAAVRDAGHEIGLHGYSHEVGSLALTQIKDV